MWVGEVLPGLRKCQERCCHQDYCISIDALKPAHSLR